MISCFLQGIAGPSGPLGPVGPPGLPVRPLSLCCVVLEHVSLLVLITC